VERDILPVRYRDEGETARGEWATEETRKIPPFKAKKRRREDRRTSPQVGESPMRAASTRHTVSHSISEQRGKRSPGVGSLS